MRTSASPVLPIACWTSSTQKLACLLLFPRPAEQPNDAFGLHVCLRLDLVSKIGHGCGADGVVKGDAGCGRIWEPEQVLVEPAHFTIGKRSHL